MNLNKRSIKISILIILVVIALVTVFITFYEKEENISKNITIEQALRAIALTKYSEEECNVKSKTYINLLSSDGIIDEDVKLEKELTYSFVREIVENMHIDSDMVDMYIKGMEGTISPDDWNKVFEYIYLASDNAKKFVSKDITVAYYNEEMVVCKEGKYRYLYSSPKKFFEKYADTSINVMTYNDEILYVGEQKADQVTYENVWIKSGRNKIKVYMYGCDRTFESAYDEELKDVVADITITNGVLTKISLKRDEINGKVLAISEKYIEIENFGKVPLDKNFKVYKNYATLTETNYKSILVGYDVQSFVVAKGEICAAVIHSDINASNIRVLLNTTGYSGIYHNEVRITCKKDFKITYNKKEKVIKAGKEFKIGANSKYFEKGRIKIEPVDGKSKLTVLNIERSYGNPSYRGTFELASTENGILIINELSMEEYLYAVVPSEMPISYGQTALEVQAVCARTYAYRQVLDNSCSEYGAHVDDSVSYQVYNNGKECKESIDAVKATYGKILTYDDKAITAFFFSTSCGATTEADIWGGENLPYIQSRFLSDKKGVDLTNEKKFDAFIRKKYDTYDKDYDLYRWNVTMTQKALSNSVDNALYTIKGVETNDVGTVTSINVLERGKGGVLKSIRINGTKGKATVNLQSNIRKLFNISGCELNTNNGNVRTDFSSLPSACFVIDKEKKDGEVYFKFIGGGFGHGVGMSQNATKTMAENGMEWDEILKYFYKGIEISDAYES